MTLVSADKGSGTAVRPEGPGRVTPARLVMIRADGTSEPVPIGRWLAPAAGADTVILDACRGATLDVGCGPGRLTVALLARGVVALGIDTSRTAVELARRRGAAALRRSVFDSLPGERRWSHALLADGNIGIGGDPVALLRRLATLLIPHGSVLVEVRPPGHGVVIERVRLAHPTGPTPPFPWAFVGADAVGELGRAAGLRVCWCRSYDNRWFAELALEYGTREARRSARLCES